MIKDTDSYKTSDFGLATFLFYNSLQYTCDKTDPARKVFVFEDAEKAKTLAIKWFAARSVLWQEIQNG